jgi:hypothetical protein
MDGRAMNLTRVAIKLITERWAMKTNISILVNVQSVTIQEDVRAATIRWLADAIRIGIGVQYAQHDTPTRPVEYDEIKGVITINEGRQP